MEVPKNEGWKSQGAAEKYINIVDIVAPGRKDILSIIAKLATGFSSARNPRIMDLGSGLGHATEEVLKYAPQASIVMLDFSEEMVAKSKEKFKSYPNVKIIQQDLNKGLGSYLETGFDAIISCFALHHIEYENRVNLYTDIKKGLKEFGVFINGDLFKGDSPAVNQWEFDNYIKWMVEQFRERLGQEYTFTELKDRQLENYNRMRDMPGTVWDMYNDLKRAGFKFVDCMYKNQNLAVLAASNK